MRGGGGGGGGGYSLFVNQTLQIQFDDDSEKNGLLNLQPN